MNDWIKLVLTGVISFAFGLILERVRPGVAERVRRRLYREKMTAELGKLIVTLDFLITEEQPLPDHYMKHDFTHYKLLASQPDLFYTSINAWAYKLIFARAYDLLYNPRYLYDQRQLAAGKLLVVIKRFDRLGMVTLFQLTLRPYGMRNFKKNLAECRKKLLKTSGQDIFAITAEEGFYEPPPDCPLHPGS